MDAVDEYLDNALESDDIFPCKGCGEILEEGKAFELAGHRWHLNCFRCNTCGTLLDSDANLLLLGDGSLICNNCTYSCSACGNKIEDLAILTGEQAFCATCFRCRNCKRKIENLRYARTSQGIFCMNCHESLMARRRKKHKAAAQAKAREKDASPMITDKSLPALPPSASTLSSTADTPTELSPRPSRVPFPSSTRPERSPERFSMDGKTYGSTVLSPSTYRNNRNSAMVTSGNLDLNSSDGESFFIPVALDTSPAPTPSRSEPSAATSNAKSDKSDPLSSAPHIAFQEKPRSSTPSDYDSSTTTTTNRNSLARNPSKAKSDKSQTSATTADEPKNPPNGRSAEFKLQDAPRSKKSISEPRPTPTSSVSFESDTPKDKNRQSVISPASTATTTPTTSVQRQQESITSPPPDAGSLPASSRPNGADQPPPRAATIPRKEVPSRAANGKPASAPLSVVTSPVPPPRPQPTEQKLTDTYMQPRAPPQPPQPPHPPQAPAPATTASHAPGKESISSTVATSSDVTTGSPPHGPSPSLPRWSSGGDFSLDEDMARILGTDESSSSILRRVSNAVRHGRNSSNESGNLNLHANNRLGHTRSLSETTRATASPRWPKTPIVEAPKDEHDISSPISASGAGTAEDAAFLKRQLRSSEQRVAELERQFGAEKDLKSLNKKLLEKRRTVSVLDTQTEIMIRQLEVLAGYVERAKTTKQPINAEELEDSAIKDFVQKLAELQKGMTDAIEQLHRERDELIEEKDQAVADRDRALLEFEQLSSKNAQLADMNNDLTHQIQERFKSQINAEQTKGASGLGIYHAHKGPSMSSSNLDSTSIQTAGGVTLIGPDADESVVESGPTVVNIRKGQVRKFNWKKGSKTVAQNFSKGVNRAVGAFQNDRERVGMQGLSGDSIGLPYNMTVASVDSPAAFPQPMQQNSRPGVEIVGPPGARGPGPAVNLSVPGGGPGMGNGANNANNLAAPAGFGFFKKNTVPRSGTAPALASMDNAVAEPPSTLFGSDLVERADFERRHIPSVVTRCIEEVELRGMDLEGIYRKTGGNSQVKAIREGFEKQEDYDISDPDLDITAVTSVLKQYFRKLPDPLLTFDVYDRILESNGIADAEERIAHLRKAINTLPQKHRDCLEFLMFHLARVANRERENLMSPKNLAVVFAPTIMRDHSLEREMTDMHAKNLAVQFIIENRNGIFSES